MGCRPDFTLKSRTEPRPARVPARHVAGVGSMAARREIVVYSRISPETLFVLRRIANTEDRPLSSVIRRALENFVAVAHAMRQDDAPAADQGSAGVHADERRRLQLQGRGNRAADH